MLSIILGKSNVNTFSDVALHAVSFQRRIVKQVIYLCTRQTNSRFSKAQQLGILVINLKRIKIVHKIKGHKKQLQLQSEVHKVEFSLVAGLADLKNDP